MGDGDSSSRLRYLSGDRDMAVSLPRRGGRSRVNCPGDGAADDVPEPSAWLGHEGPRCDERN